MRNAAVATERLKEHYETRLSRRIWPEHGQGAR
jgi:hypothetical protein